jgi:hypothetical protein
MYNCLPRKRFSSLYSVNELLPGNFANIFCLSVSLHLSFTTLTFLSSYILVDSSIQMPIQYYVLSLSLHSPTFYSYITFLPFIALFYRFLRL